MIDIREAHYRVLALKRTDSSAVNELNRYIVLKSLYRLRSAFDPALRPLADQKLNNLIATIQTKCFALGFDMDLKTKIHHCDSTHQKVDVIDEFIRKCRRRFSVQKLFARVTVIGVMALIAAVLLLN